MGISRHRVNVVLNEEQHGDFTAAAEELGLSSSSLARAILLEWLRGTRSLVRKPDTATRKD